MQKDGLISSEQADNLLAQATAVHEHMVETLRNEADATASGNMPWRVISLLDGIESAFPGAVQSAATLAELSSRRFRFDEGRDQYDPNTRDALQESFARNELQIREWNRIADRNVADMIGALYGGFDMAKGAYRIGVNGEHTFDNYVSALSGVFGAPLGGAVKVGRKFVTPLVNGGRAAESISTSSSHLRAIAAGAADLSPRQASVLGQLEGFGSRAVIPKRGFGQNDLAALSAATGDEFAMFTTGGRRLLIRGDATGVPISIADGSAQSLASQGWRWSSHVHPDGSLMSSAGDRAVLSVFGNSRSTVLSPTGGRGLFNPNSDMIGPGWLPGGR